MAVFQEPSQWTHELGNNADVSTLPDDTGATTGVASLQKLFQLINQTPLEAGGVAPEREDINALFKYLGDQIFYTQNGGVPSYNADYDYIAGRVVLYNDNIYKCIQANGASSTVVAPDSDDTYWQQLDSTQSDSTSLIPNQTIISELPLTDANLHLKDGALLSGSGAYSAYVDLIADLYNGGTATTSFCTEAEWQTSNANYGFCNKFVYDSVANTVRLPKVNSLHGALIKSYQSGYDWVRIYEDGWCEQGSTIPDSAGELTVNLLRPFINVNYDVTLTDGRVSGAGQNNSSIRVRSTSSFTAYFNSFFQLWSASGYTDISDLQVSPIYEYIVVGTISKTDIQIDIDNVLADLNGKADTDLSNVPSSKGILVESYSNGSSWYRVYSDGFCIQGGIFSVTANLMTVNLLKEMADSNYVVTISECNPATSPSYYTSSIQSRTQNQMQIQSNYSGGNTNMCWVAYGYIS